MERYFDAVNELKERFEKLKDVLYNYIEMGSNINLGTVKAALKSV